MPAVRHFSCSPEAVFGVLADGWTYPVWVVGASRMRAVDSHWPAVGAKLHHSAGVWPALINDSTSLLHWEPPRRMVLEARGWPFGKAEVTLAIEPSATGCTVSISEDVSGGPALLVPKPVRLAAMKWRNTETLRRLAYLAEGGAGAD